MTITATEFKAKCLKLLDQVTLTGETIKVTKRGKVVAQLIRAQQEGPKKSGFGFAKGQMTIVGDVMAPLDVQWDGLE